MNHTSLSYKILKNIAYSFFNYGWTIVFAIFITPVIVFKLGIDTYGVFIFIGTIASLFGLIDLGLSTSVSKYISEYHGAKNEKGLENLIYSTNFIFLIIGSIGFIGLSSIGLVCKYFLTSTAFLAYNLPVVFFITGCIFFIQAVNSVYTITITSLQRFDLLSKIGVVLGVLSSLSVLLAVLLGFKLQAIFIIQLIFAIISTFVFRHFSQKILNVARLKFRWNKKEIIKCYKFGLVASVSHFSEQAVMYLDKIIIPIFLNPISLSYYSLSGSIASKSTGLITGLSDVLFPMVSSLQGSKNLEVVKNLYIRSFRLITVLSASISFSIAFFSYKIMKYWLNSQIADSTYIILIILVATYFIISLTIPLKNFLLGLGKTKVLAKVSVFMAILNIVLLFILLPKFGIIGAAIAYLISILPALYLFYFIEKNVFFLENRVNYYLKLYVKIGITAAVAYLIDIVFIDQFITSFKSLLVLGPISVILYCVIYKLFGFYEKEDLRILSNFMKKILEKLVNLYNNTVYDKK